MAYVRCIRAFDQNVPGDVVEIPDGSEASEFFFEPCDAPAPVTPPVTPPVA